MMNMALWQEIHSRLGEAARSLVIPQCFLYLRETIGRMRRIYRQWLRMCQYELKFLLCFDQTLHGQQHETSTIVRLHCFSWLFVLAGPLHSILILFERLRVFAGFCCNFSRDDTDPIP